MNDITFSEALRHCRALAEAGETKVVHAVFTDKIQYLYRLRDGEWEEAQPGGDYYFDGDEFDFWNPTGWEDHIGMVNVAYIETAQCRLVTEDQAEVLLVSAVKAA